MDKTIKQKGFNFGWQGINAKPTVSIDGYYEMREWQTRAFDTLKDAHCSIINAPMGSGKSWLMNVLSAHKMQSDPLLRCIISVPQTIIGGGFAEANLIMPSGEKLYWFAQHDLCTDEPNDGTINTVISFLKGPQSFFADRVLLCSHSTLAGVYSRLKKEKNLDLFSDLLLWVDEAHHIKNVELSQGGVISNTIGELVRFLVNRPKQNVQIGLSTASFFRGDRYSLITNAMEKKFTRFNFPYDEHLNSMQYMRTFSFEFRLCGTKYTDEMKEVVSTRKGKDIIYIPRPNSRHSTGDKYAEVEQIVNIYKELYGGEEHDYDNGTIILGNNGESFKILDLVDENDRDEKKDFIRKIDKSRSPDDLDAIIALGMFREGANWIWADRSIIVGARASLVDVIQMLGRLFRDAPGKQHVEVIQLLPFSMDQVNKEKFEHNLNGYMKAVLASLILENILNPINIMTPKEAGDGSGNRVASYLNLLVHDETKRQALVNDVVRELIDIINTDEYIADNSILWGEYEKIVPVILSKYDIHSHVEEIEKEIWMMYSRRTLELKGLDVNNFDFDIIKNMNPIGFITEYTTGACGIDTFRELREAIGGSGKSVEEWVLIAEKLAAENGGMLPSRAWLRKNQYTKLATMIDYKPELFTHIKQEKTYNSLEEHVQIAEKLAAENGGILPSGAWLRKNRYGLRGTIRLHPELFAHIKQENRKELPKERVLLAEQLALSNGGILPSDTWLINNKYSGLVTMIQKYPELFTHIKQENLFRSPEEWIPIAEQLSLENGGILPSCNWLQNNKYGGLVNMFYKHPELFAHIKRTDPTCKTSEKWVLIAEQLAYENNDILPSKTWLKNNNYPGLASSIYKHPELFTHVKQVELRKTPEEWVSIAEKLVIDNGGILPSSIWLAKNNYSGLVGALHRHPELFTHIKRRTLKSCK